MRVIAQMFNANLNSRLRPHFEYVKPATLIFRSFSEISANPVPNPCLMSVRTSADGEHTDRRFCVLTSGDVWGLIGSSTHAGSGYGSTGRGEVNKRGGSDHPGRGSRGRRRAEPGQGHYGGARRAALPCATAAPGPVGPGRFVEGWSSADTLKVHGRAAARAAPGLPAGRHAGQTERGAHPATCTHRGCWVGQ